MTFQTCCNSIPTCKNLISGSDYPKGSWSKIDDCLFLRMINFLCFVIYIRVPRSNIKEGLAFTKNEFLKCCFSSFKNSSIFYSSKFDFKPLDDTINTKLAGDGGIRICNKWGRNWHETKGHFLKERS